MMTLIFAIMMLAVFGKLLAVAVKATWGISKVIVSCVLFPLVLIGLVVGGLMYIALPILIITGVVMLLAGPRN